MDVTRAGSIFVGTSGWAYDHWAGPFYPEDLAASDRLAFLAERLPSVEINRSFYSLPEPEVLHGWHDVTPPGFVFAFKASRYLTHMKKLKDPAGPLATMLDRAAGLRDKLGPLLFQLPPHWRRNLGRLGRFLSLLPRERRCAFEFRDPSWYADDVLELLAEHAAAFCIYELAGHSSPRHVTADFVYVRLHGPAAAYQGSYGVEALAGWAVAFSTWARQGRDVFCYFDNDQAGHAARNAVRLWEMVSG
jgi:uncharacterized protein YecE (DUF72 family)